VGSLQLNFAPPLAQTSSYATGCACNLDGA